MTRQMQHKPKFDTVIFDGSHACHRLSAANPPLNNSKGQRTEVVFGLCRLISSVLRANQSSKCALVWDGRESRKIRLKIDAAYKAHRTQKDDGTKERIQSMHEQVGRFWEQFGSHLPIHWLISDKYEADDIIAMFARTEEFLAQKVLIVSGDKDLLQLVTDNITVYSPFSNKYYTPKNFSELTGGFPDGVAWLAAKCLMGDSSDNIKGVGGVGEKTALKILQSCEFSLGLLKNFPPTDVLKGKLHELFQKESTWERIAINYKLMSLFGPVHQRINADARRNITHYEGKMDTRTLQVNMARNQFASVLANFTGWVSPFKLLER